MDLSSHRLLVVGAGGIGCELLKNLVLTGFTEIQVIDLDTIELSNLNRQFLFQKCHVGKPKALIARESVLKYNPNANITAYHDSIMNQKYNVDYFKQFSIVLNALDNKAARSHVNRLCLAADVPLIESGSAGYLGQVTLIKKNTTECYDCLPKPPQKTFPGCTIRNTPSEPIHCIVWAKHLFNQLFGAEDPDEAVSPDGEDPENMASAGQNSVEKTEVVRVSTRQWAKETKYNPDKLFNKLFNDDVKYLLSMSKLWEKRKPPTPLDWSECINNSSILLREDQNSQENSKMTSLRIWSMNECCKIFKDSINNLYQRLTNAGDDGILCWDKDDEDAMNFVASAANLRCVVFSIVVKSKFEIKSLAGNIIPAIATTNAIVAGLIVLEALKVLENKTEECKTVYLRDRPIQNKIIVPGQLVKPNPKCYVCAVKPEILVKINLNTFTVKQFETKILKQELNMVQPDVEIDDGTGRIIISSEEGETDANNEKTLSTFGLTDQSRLKCDDFFQDYELKIILYHSENLDSTKEYEFISDSQTIKDIQINVEKENLKQRQLEEERKLRPVEEDIIIESVKSSEDKKRSYEKAFLDENLPSEEEASSKKLKPEESEDLTSTSVNNASDVISDEDEVKNNQQCENDVLLEEVEEIMIEDDSKQVAGNLNGQNGHKTLPKENNDSNGSSDEDDDDIIECSSEDDVIEINDDESQSRQTVSSNYYQNGNTNPSTVDSSTLNDEGSNDEITLE